MSLRPFIASFACSNSLSASKKKSPSQNHFCDSDNLNKVDSYKKCRRCKSGSFSRVWGWFHKKNCIIKEGKESPKAKPIKNEEKWFKYNKQKKKIKNIECGKCDFRTYYKSGLEKHILFKHTPDELVKWHPCHLCNHKSKRKTDLNVHLKRMHYQIEKKFKCDQCTYTSHSKENLRKHILSIHLRIPAYKCKICDYKSSKNSILKQHILEVHSIIASRKFSCDQCSYTSDKKPHIEAHKVSQHMPKELINWIECDQCNYKTHYKRYLDEHIKRQHSSAYKMHTKELLCDECPYVTNSLNSFKKHKISRHLTATEIKWFNCSTCDYKSKSNAGLKAHFKFSHLNFSRKFNCNECTFASPTKKKLKEHQAEHVIGEYLACDQCSYTSQIKYDLDQHSKSVHIVKEYKCKHCSYKAVAMNSVKGHVRKMHPKKQNGYQCDVCDF